jgi:zinc protease
MTASPLRWIVPALVLGVGWTVVARGQAPDRSRPPAVGQPPAFSTPPIVKRSLSNGLPVWIVERHDVPVVQVNLVVRGGASLDPAGTFGLASLTADLMDEGAGSRSALDLADAVDFLGAELTTGASMDAFAVRLHAVSARLADALPIMADVVLRPALAEPDFERLRTERLVGLRQARDEPAAIAGTAFLRVVFGQSHRYGTSEVGTAESLARIGVADVRAFHERAYRPDASLIVVAGDVTADTVLPLLERTFGGWKAPALPAPAGRVSEAPQLRRRQIVLVDKPGAAQSEIRIGRVGVPRATPDLFPLIVLNTALGGSFTSRLNQNLRETHGYAYGASSSFVMRRAAGPFLAGAAVQTDRTAESVREFFNEFAGVRAPLPASDLEKARNYVALRFPAQFTTTRQIAARLEELFVHDLPDDFYSTYVGRVLQVSPADVAGAAARHIQPETFAVVVVGDRREVEPKLRALGLGPVRVASIDEFMGPGAAPAGRRSAAAVR